jgi:hypothetical protein
LTKVNEEADSFQIRDGRNPLNLKRKRPGAIPGTAASDASELPSSLRLAPNLNVAVDSIDRHIHRP